MGGGKRQERSAEEGSLGPCLENISLPLRRERPPCLHSRSRPCQRAGKEAEDLTSSPVAGRQRCAMLWWQLQWRRCVCRAEVPGDSVAPQAGISIPPEITSDLEPPICYSLSINCEPFPFTFPFADLSHLLFPYSTQQGDKGICCSCSEDRAG